jgi:hypothetical protein
MAAESIPPQVLAEDLIFRLSCTPSRMWVMTRFCTHSPATRIAFFIAFAVDLP